MPTLEKTQYCFMFIQIIIQLFRLTINITNNSSTHRQQCKTTTRTYAVMIFTKIFTLTVFQMILYRGGLVETGSRSPVHILETRFQIIESTGWYKRPYCRRPNYRPRLRSPVQCHIIELSGDRLHGWDTKSNQCSHHYPAVLKSLIFAFAVQV